MISRQLWKSLQKPLPISQSLFRSTFTPISTYNFASSQSKFNSQQSKNNSSYEEQEHSRDREQRSHNRNGYVPLVYLVPLLAIATHKVTKASCLFSSPKFEKDKVTNRVELIEYPANSPMQDRWAVAQLEAIPGYVAVVLDGHNGWQLAEYAKANLIKELEKALKANKSKSFENKDEYIKASLKEAFEQVESGFLKIAKNTYNMGFPAIGSVGTCALVALVHGNKLYSANLGDSKGVIYKNEKGKVVGSKKINHKHSAGSQKEQNKLKENFKDEHNIYVCDMIDTKSCFVKNKIRVTRSLGDFDLKYDEFNNPKDLGSNFGYRMKIDNFKGPYITSEPEIQVVDLEKNDKYLVLSTNGVWEQLSKKEVSQIVEKNLSDKQKLTSDLISNSVQKAAQKNNRSEAEARGTRLGNRRKIHDDMTVIVVDLENQAK